MWSKMAVGSNVFRRVYIDLALCTVGGEGHEGDAPPSPRRMRIMADMVKLELEVLRDVPVVAMIGQ